MEDSIRRLEERVAWLQRHVVEQDKAMLEMSDRIERLCSEIASLRERREQDREGGAGGGISPAEERPPHY